MALLMKARNLLQLARSSKINSSLQNKTSKSFGVKVADETLSTAIMSDGNSQTGQSHTGGAQSKTKLLLGSLQQKKLSTGKVRTKRTQSEKGVDVQELKRNDRVNKWIIMDLIGKGAFGCVYKVCLLIILWPK